MNQDQGCRTYNDERPKSPIEKRQSNLNSFLQFREKKEKPEILFTSFESRASEWQYVAVYDIRGAIFISDAVILRWRVV